MAEKLRRCTFGGEPIRVQIDDRDIRGGEKAWEWIKKGVPLLLEIGIRDIGSDSVCLRRRDNPPNDKETMSNGEFISSIADILEDINKKLFARALSYRNAKSRPVESREELLNFFKENGSGFVHAHWCGDQSIERQMRDDFGLTTRCLPFGEPGIGRCVFTGKPSEQRVVWAKSY
jgi:prolyl-tRNA synthetase